MENKYYTPSIEEFHVGFEYEHKHSIPPTWSIDTVAVLDYDFPDMGELSYLESEIDQGNIRVKYLDKEDIESLGWKFLYTKTIKTINGNKTDVLDFIFTVNDRLKYELRCKVEDTTRVIITVPSEIFSIPLTIKNKSELKRLMQQLEIL